MAKTNPLIPLVDIQQQDQPSETSSSQLITFGTITGGTPYAGSSYAGIFALECLLQDKDGSGVYQMTGTVAVPAWTKLGAVPIVNAITTTVGGAATENFATGDFANVLATDTILTMLSDDGTNNVSIVSAIAKAASVDVVFSGDPSSDTILSIIVLRP